MWSASWQAADRLLPVALLLTICLAAAGCGGGPAARDSNALPAPDDIEGWNRRIPAGVIAVWGMSDESPRQAELDAKAQVAATIQSTLESETTSFMAATMRDADVQDVQEMTSRVTVRTTFSRAELIRVVPGTAHHKDGVYRVMAGVERQELATALSADYEAASVRFRSNGELLAGLTHELPAYTAAWSRTRDAYADVLARAVEVRTASRLDPAGLAADRDSWRRLEAERAALLNGLTVVIQLKEHPELNHQELAERLRAGFARLGVGASGSRCVPGAALLELEPILTWTRVIGRVCALELSGELRPCDGDDIWTEVEVSDSALRGEGRDPVGQLQRNLTPEILASLLRESLSHVIPF